ncbi:MAG: hypothetical protein LBN20_04090, partial [Endomicrobium sp.]|nr:hypothetical protein [Endomicrobium sp.]
FVNPIFNDYGQYSGLYLLIAIVFFAFQLYADFSGCMDIVIGAGQMFGIKMTENFNTPFFSRSISEFWRRWHITLGAWMKDYVFYPLLKSNFLQGLIEKLKPILGKRAAKAFSLYLGMLILWFAMGLWHGAAWHFIIGTGLIYWFYIVLGEICKPISKEVLEFLQINKNSFYWKTFQNARTFALMCISFIFFRASSATVAVSIINKVLSFLEIYIYLILLIIVLFGIFRTVYIQKKIKFWIFPIAAALSSGIGIMSVRILTEKATFFVIPKIADFQKEDFIFGICCIIFLMSYEFIRQQIGSIREQIAKQPRLIRWLFYWALLFIVIMFGRYGGLTAVSFIYQGF